MTRIAAALQRACAQAPSRGAGKRAPAWSFNGDGVAAAPDASAAAAAACVDDDVASPSDAPQAPPASGIEYERAWRKASSAHGRLALLRRVPAEAYPALFKARFQSGFLVALGLQRRCSYARLRLCMLAG